MLDQAEVVHEPRKAALIHGRTVGVLDETLEHLAEAHGLGDVL